MTATALYQAGRLDQAIEALGVELRDHPGDARRRTFLFELLCFSGNHARAARQLDVLAREGPLAETGTLVYRAALDATRTRRTMFADGSFPLPRAADAAAPVRGTLNGHPFTSLADADPRVGPRFEMFAGDRYLLVPLAQLAAVRAEAPRRLRDLLWLPARVHTGPALRALELGDVLLPVLAPTTADEPAEAVRLGRVTEWRDRPGAAPVPVGQRMLLVDGEEVPLLELRELVIDAPASEGCVVRDE